MKTETKHTPGPWNCVSTSHHAHDYRLLTVDLMPMDFDGNETARANARLIAAAPELLEACKHALESFGGVRPEDYAVASRREFDMLASAIAKAEGSI